MRCLAVVVLAVVTLVAGGCVDCGEGTCECADGEKIRVRSAPCQCGAVCAPHGGVCRDDYAGCPTDAAGSVEDAGGMDAGGLDAGDS